MAGGTVDFGPPPKPQGVDFGPPPAHAQAVDFGPPPSKPSLLARVGQAAKSLLPTTEDQALYGPGASAFAGPAIRMAQGIGKQAWQDVNTLSQASAPSAGVGAPGIVETPAQLAAPRPSLGAVGGAALRTGLMLGGAGMLGRGAGALASRVLPEAIAAPVARVATGAAAGAAFSPTDPAVGAIVGGAAGAVPEVGKLPEATTPLRRRIAEAIDPSIAERLRTAETSPVSGLPTRPAYERALPTAESDPNTAIVRFDLNGLKGVNDNLGHAAGDAALSKAGSALRDASTASGIPARAFHVSGDEFAALVPASKAQAFRDAAETAYGVQEHAPGVKSSLSGGIGASDAEADQATYARK